MTMLGGGRTSSSMAVGSSPQLIAASARVARHAAVILRFILRCSSRLQPRLSSNSSERAGKAGLAGSRRTARGAAVGANDRTAAAHGVGPALVGDPDVAGAPVAAPPVEPEVTGVRRLHADVHLAEEAVCCAVSID